MTLILKLDLDIVMTYFCTKNEVNRSIGYQKETETDRQTDTNLNLKLTPFDIAHRSKGNPFQVCLTVST